MDRKERIKALKRKNAITNLCKIWEKNGILITPEDFLDVEETLDIQKIILNKMYELDNGGFSEIYKKDERNIVGIYTEKLRNSINDDCTYVFFVRNPIDYGGIVLTGEVLKKNIDFIVSESEFYFNICCIFCCSIKKECGVCLWSGEYDYRIYIW